MTKQVWHVVEDQRGLPGIKFPCPPCPACSGETEALERDPKAKAGPNYLFLCKRKGCRMFWYRHETQIMPGATPGFNPDKHNLAP